MNNTNIETYGYETYEYKGNFHVYNEEVEIIFHLEDIDYVSGADYIAMEGLFNGTQKLYVNVDDEKGITDAVTFASNVIPVFLKKKGILVSPEAPLTDKASQGTFSVAQKLTDLKTSAKKVAAGKIIEGFKYQSEDAAEKAYYYYVGITKPKIDALTKTEKGITGLKPELIKKRTSENR